MEQQPANSWKDENRVSSAVIQERLETVRTLREDELELYEIAKDTATGEHYLHYSYMHRNIGAIGTGADPDEIYHQLMPIESDDVLGFLFSDQPYTYPEHWTSAFLRNGPEGDYVWFDPTYAQQEAEYDAIGQSIADELARFKTQGDLSEEALQRLLKKLDAEGGEKS